MSEIDERNIPVPLDNLDYEAPALGGLTYKELVVTIMLSYVLSLFVFVPLAVYALGNFLFGFVLSALFSIVFTAKFMRKAYILKKDRPSYMIWVNMLKHIQNKGILGMKIPLGYIKTTYWSTSVKKGE